MGCDCTKAGQCHCKRIRRWQTSALVPAGSSSNEHRTGRIVGRCGVAVADRRHGQEYRLGIRVPAPKCACEEVGVQCQLLQTVGAKGCLFERSNLPQSPKSALLRGIDVGDYATTNRVARGMSLLGQHLLVQIVLPFPLQAFDSSSFHVALPPSFSSFAISIFQPLSLGFFWWGFLSLWSVPGEHKIAKNSDE